MVKKTPPRMDVWITARGMVFNGLRASDPMAVVDQYGRVHGLDNLRVADASVMPDCIRANTNATTIMIGERVADFLKAEK